MSTESTGVPTGVPVLDDENLSESFPGPCAPMTRDVILRIYPPLVRTLARSAGLPEPASPVVFIEGRAYYSISSLSSLLRTGPEAARNLLPTHGQRPRIPLQTLRPLLRELISTFRKVEDGEVEFLRDLDTYLRIERSRFNPESDWSGIRESLLPFIDETRRRFEPVLRVDVLALFLDDLYRWIGRKAPVRTDPSTASCLRSIRHLRSAIYQDSAARDYLLSCAGTGHYSPAMLRLRNDDLAHLLNDFLDEFGDRCPGELKLETRSYREYPELFLPILLQDTERKPSTIITAGGRSQGVTGWVDRKFAALISFRQSSRWMRARAFGVLRGRLLQMGKFLEEKGAIESREDVFYFHLEELIAMDQPGGNYRDLIMDRRVIHYDQGEINVHGRLRHDHEGNWVPDAGPQREVLRASQSLDLPMEGEVLLISQEDRMPESPEVLKGKILVMHAASPGIVHQLPWIAGLICESGSTLSHSSVLCREFGIPAIFGVKGAFERLQSGQKIRFLPRSGIIEPIG